MTILAVLVLLTARPQPQYAEIGVPLIVIGQAIRLLAAGHLRKGSELVTWGPYALCRNPLFVGSFFMTVGYLVFFGRWEIVAFGVIAFWIFHGGAIAYEEKELRNKFGARYDEYARRVPRFIPRLRADYGRGTFSWQQVVTNNEHRTAILNLFLCALLLVNSFTVRLSPVAWLVAMVR